MTIYLSALGWIPESPAGNRLRWHYPVQSVDSSGKKYVGLPRSVIVERAPVGQQDLFHDKRGTVAYPYTWWDGLGDVPLAGLSAVQSFPLPAPVQAVSFTWRGGPVRILLRNEAADANAADLLVNDGESVYAEAAAIDTIAVMGESGMLDNLRVLDLFRDRGLEWKPLAEIGVASTYRTGLDEAGKRCADAPAIMESEWKELIGLASDGEASDPSDAQQGEPTAWDQFTLVLGLRWEIALLGGFAFFDGPHKEVSGLDRIQDRLLQAPPSVMMAYRIRDPKNKAALSNIAVCPAALAAPLGAPDAPQYVDPTVRLKERTSSGVFPAGLALIGPMKGFTPLLPVADEYGVRLTVRSRQTDQRALGLEFEEIISGSPATGAASRRHSFQSRTRKADEEDPWMFSLARSFDVSFPDVKLQARARAIDAWDRVSPYSGWSAPTPLALRHEPAPPPLDSAFYAAGSGHIVRTAGIPDWQPDPLVSRTGGRLRIYRQTSAPRMADVTVGLPIPAGDGSYRAAIGGAFGSPGDYAGGTLRVGSFVETIVFISASEIVFRIPDNAGSGTVLFDPGPGRLLQDPKHSSLWSQVADFPANALPAELVFSDPLPPPAGTAVESYMARLAYFGRLGPAGGIVRAIRRPVVPVVPPPFTVDVLGIDFYHRTMLKLRFTTPVGSGKFTVWWADGVVPAADLPRRGAAGQYGEQEAQDGSILYEVIAMPIPQHVGRTVTIGVQRAGTGGVQSDFATVTFVLPALVG